MTKARARRAAREGGKRVRKGGRKTLVDLDRGQTGIIDAIDEEICPRVSVLGLRPGKRVEVHSKHPFKGPIVVSVDRSTASLCRRYAREIEVVVEE